MGWRELLIEKEESQLVAPWLGGQVLQIGARRWLIDGDLPEEHGWYAFECHGRRARLAGVAEASRELLGRELSGFAIGDHLVLDDSSSGRAWCARCGFVPPATGDRERAAQCVRCAARIVRLERVHLVEPGLERFTRIAAGRIHGSGPLVYSGPVYPLGPEPDVQRAYEDRVHDLGDIRGVTPALDAAFRVEVWRRDEAARQRAEAERRRREEEEKRAKEARRRAVIEQLGDAKGRREAVQYDFAEAARAALAVGGAEYVDHRVINRAREYAVRFRLLKRRFECTCDERLRIVDSGICLIDHTTGEKGDGRFTLESLPSVIREAHAAEKLVVFRHI